MAKHIIPSLRSSEPTPSRRSLLSFLTATVAAAPVVALCVSPTKAAAVVAEESPDLLDIGRRLPGLQRAYRVATEAKAKARETYERLRPALPDELIKPPATGQHLAASEADLEGNTIYFYGENRAPRHIYRWKLLQLHIIQEEFSPGSKMGKKLRKLARLAKKYEAATKRALTASGWCAADDAVSSAEYDIENLLRELLDMRPNGPAGLAIFAGAVLAEVERNADDTYGRHGLAPLLAPIMAEAIIRVEGA